MKHLSRSRKPFLAPAPIQKRKSCDFLTSEIKVLEINIATNTHPIKLNIKYTKHTNMEIVLGILKMQLLCDVMAQKKKTCQNQKKR